MTDVRSWSRFGASRTPTYLGRRPLVVIGSVHSGAVLLTPEDYASCGPTLAVAHDRKLLVRDDDTRYVWFGQDDKINPKDRTLKLAMQACDSAWKEYAGEAAYPLESPPTTSPEDAAELAFAESFRTRQGPRTGRWPRP